MIFRCFLGQHGVTWGNMGQYGVTWGNMGLGIKFWPSFRSQIWVRIPYNTEFLNIFYKKVSLRLGVYDPNEYFISVGAGMVAIFQNIPVEYMKKYFSFSLIRTKKYVFLLF